MTDDRITSKEFLHPDKQAIRFIKIGIAIGLLIALGCQILGNLL